jgi:EpsI family protein
MSKFQLHALIMIVLCGLTLAGTKAVAPTQKGRVTTDFSAIPFEFGGWPTLDDPGFDAESKRLLPSSSLMRRFYEHSDYDTSIELAIVYGADLGNFHQPEICLEGQGWRGQSKRLVRIKDADGSSFNGMSLIMTHETQGRTAFLYWFTSEGTTSTSLGNYKTRVLVNRLLLREVQPSAMIRLSAPVVDSDEDAVKLLVDFGESALPFLKKEFARPTIGME